MALVVIHAMAENKESLRALPSVAEVMGQPEMTPVIAAHGREVVKYGVQQVIELARADILAGKPAPSLADVVASVERRALALCRPALTKVINATGVILHTNLGRAPLGQAAVAEIAAVAVGYSNLEFDLAGIRRGNRNTHLREMLGFLTGAESALIVNNNAAGIMLTLNVLAAGQEVIISRGEMIEIGDSFRIPEIMAASGARMVEVGTTNRTRLSDYENAIGADTALIFKAHKSNYCIKGFTGEVAVADLAKLAHARGVSMMFDIGSGLLRRSRIPALRGEPDVSSALAAGADVVAFSCDKLLGGPQAGVLAGRAGLISRMARTPMMRAFRVGKLTLAALSAACRHHLREEDLIAANPTFAMLSRTQSELERLAAKLRDELNRLGVACRVVESFGQCGGGALPDVRLRSVAIEVLPQKDTGTQKISFAEGLYQRLVKAEPPVLGVLREGRILLDVLTLAENEVAHVARATVAALESGGET